MPAVSKAQQRFMGMVHAADKGETPASPEVAKVSADMKDSDAKDFASTKHDGLPDHVKEQLKSVVREVIREKNGMNEMSGNDVHFKHIMKMYDRGGSFTKKKIGAVVCKDPKATRKDIEEVLFDSDYRDIIEFEDELGLKEIREKYSSVNEAVSVSQVRSTIAKVKKQIIQKWKQKGGYENFGEKEGRMLSDKFNANPYGSSDERRIHSMIQDFENWAMNYDGRSESVNEAPQKVGNVNAFGASKVLGKGKKVLGFVADTPNAVATLIQDFPQAMEIEFKQGFFSDGKLLKSIKKGDKVWKELEKRYIDKQTKDAMKAGFSINEEHDCGCNENHDCGCGGVHEHIHEDLSADANGIAGLTASRASAVKDFLEKNNINSNKLYLSLKKGNLKDRMDFVTALVGKPGNPIQKKVISQFTK